MTCIVGVRDRKSKSIVFGSDRGLFLDSEVIISDNPKIFSKSYHGGKKNFIVGACGDASFCDKFEIADFNDLIIDDAYTKIDIKHFVKEKLIPYLEISIPNVKKLVSESNFLLGIEDSIFYIDSALSVTKCPDWGMATGSAGSWARGALFALKEYDIPAHEKIKIALSASEQCCTECRGPFDYLELTE